MNNQECKARPKIIDVNNNEPVFYPYSIKVNKCSGSCSNINDSYAKLCVPDIIKNINFKVFNLMSRINETRQIIWHETCKCVCRLTSAVCNSMQIWNEDKCRCECRKSLVDKLVAECINVIDSDTMYNETLTVASSNGCSSCATYIILFSVFLSISVVISGVFVYFHWYKNKQLNLKNILNVNYSKTETEIY